MSNHKRNTVSIIGIFANEPRWASLKTLLWIDGDDIAKRIWKAKAKKSQTAENTKKCEICGKQTVSYHVCQKCRKAVCHDCAKKDPTGMYCPACFGKLRSISKLA